MQEHLYKHFRSDGHKGFLNEVSVTFVDDTDGKDSKKRERYWIQTLKTTELYGLDIANSVESAHTLLRLFFTLYYFRSNIVIIVFYFYSFLELIFL